MPFDTEQTSEKTDKTGDADPAMQRKVVSIVGPTASGKTGLGIAVAKALARKGEQAEIINADAYQMYRGMDIGTAKASLEEQAQVRHHLIDIIEIRLLAVCLESDEMQQIVVKGTAIHALQRQWNHTLQMYVGQEVQTVPRPS